MIASRQWEGHDLERVIFGEMHWYGGTLFRPLSSRIFWAVDLGNSGCECKTWQLEDFQQRRHMTDVGESFLICPI